MTSIGIQYVTTAGDDANDGLSWATAKRTITAAFSGLMDAYSGTVYVGAGVFTVPAPGILMPNNTWIKGQGPYATRIQADQASPPASIITAGTGPNSNYYSGVQAMTLQAIQQTPSSVLMLNGTQWFILRDCYIDASQVTGKDAIVLVDNAVTIDNKMINVKMQNCAGRGVYVGVGAHGLTIEDSMFASFTNPAASTGVFIEGAINIKLRGCVIGDATIGVNVGGLNGGADVHMDRLYLEAIHGAGILINGNGGNGPSQALITSPISVGFNAGSNGLRIHDLGGVYWTTNGVTVIGGSLGSQDNTYAVYADAGCKGPLTLINVALGGQNANALMPQGPGLPTMDFTWVTGRDYYGPQAILAHPEGFWQFGGPGIKVPSLTGDPAAPVNGTIWYNSTSNTLKCVINGVVKTFAVR